MRTLLLLLALFINFYSVAVADTFEETRTKAEQGEAKAQYNLGLKYAREQGVPQDYAEAAKWYRKAADQGDGIAQFSLGGMYDKGQGVLQDYVQAHKWLNLAAAKLTGDFRTSAEKDREHIAAKMTRVQIAEAQKLAREWKPTAPQP